MRSNIKTIIALIWLIFNSLWLSHFFIILFLNGEYLVTEPNKWIAAFEIALTLSIAGLGFERLTSLRQQIKNEKVT